MAPPADRPATKIRPGSIPNSAATALRDAGEDRRFPGTAPLVAGPEPVPAGGRVVERRLTGIDHQQAMALGERIHVRAHCKIVGVLLAAVQHDHEAAVSGPGRRRDIELVAARAGGAGEGPGEKLRPIRNCGRSMARRVRLRRLPAEGEAALAQGVQHLAQRPSKAGRSTGIPRRVFCRRRVRHRLDDLGVGIQAKSPNGLPNRRLRGGIGLDAIVRSGKGPLDDPRRLDRVQSARGRGGTPHGGGKVHVHVVSRPFRVWGLIRSASAAFDPGL